MDLPEHFRIIRRWAPAILLVSLATAAVVFSVSRSRDPVYAADAEVDVIPDATRSGETITQEEVEIITRRAAAFVESNAVLRDGAERAGVDLDLATLKDRVSTRETDSPGFLEVRATAPSRVEAEALVDGLTDALISVAEEDDNVVRVVAAAKALADPVSPRPWRDALLGLLLSLVATAELIALVSTFSGRFSTARDRRDVERMAGAPVLGVVPLRRRRPALDALHELRERIEMMTANADVRTIAVVGVTRGSGASYIARGLAETAAVLGQSVVLVDANVNDPSLAAHFRVAADPGLGDAARTDSFDLTLLRPAAAALPRLRLLTAGLPVGTAWRLGGGTLAKVLAQITDAEMILVDGPAVTDGNGATTVATQCDAVLLVVDARRSQRGRTADAAERLHQVRAPVIGCVVNKVKSGRGARLARRERRHGDREVPGSDSRDDTGASEPEALTTVSWRPGEPATEERG